MEIFLSDCGLVDTDLLNCVSFGLGSVAVWAGLDCIEPRSFLVDLLLTSIDQDDSFLAILFSVVVFSVLFRSYINET